MIDPILYLVNNTLYYTDRIIPGAAENVTKKTVQLDASTVEIEERGVAKYRQVRAPLTTFGFGCRGSSSGRGVRRGRGGGGGRGRGSRGGRSTREPNLTYMGWKSRRI